MLGTKVDASNLKLKRLISSAVIFAALASVAVTGNGLLSSTGTASSDLSHLNLTAGLHIISMLVWGYSAILFFPLLHLASIILYLELPNADQVLIAFKIALMCVIVNFLYRFFTQTSYCYAWNRPSLYDITLFSSIYSIIEPLIKYKNLIMFSNNGVILLNYYFERVFFDLAGSFLFIIISSLVASIWLWFIFRDNR